MKISLRETHYKGNKLWAFPDISMTVGGDGVTVEVAYSPELEFVYYFINRVLVEGDMVVEMADCFDNDQERAYIMDHIRTEQAHAAVIEDCMGEI